MKKLFLFLILLLFFQIPISKVCISAQEKTFSIQEEINSIRQLKNKNSNLYFNKLIEIGNYYQSVDLDSALYFHEKARKISSQNQNKLNECFALREIIWDYYVISEFEKASSTAFETLAILKTIKSHKKDVKTIQASVFSHLGAINIGQGLYSKSIEYYFKYLKVCEELNNKKAIATAYGNIAINYNRMNDSKKSLKYNLKAVKIDLENNDLEGLSFHYLNIGNNYVGLDQYENALNYYFKAKILLLKTNNQIDLVTVLCNIAHLYSEKNEFDKAKSYLNQALEIAENYKIEANLSLIYANLSIIHLKKGNLNQSKQLNEKSLFYAEKLQQIERIRLAYSNFYDYYKIKKDYKNALKYFELNKIYEDSILNDETRKESIQKELQFDYEKKSTTDSLNYAKEKEIKQIEIAKQKAELKVKKNQQYALFGGLLLLLIFIFFVINRYRKTNSQKKLIEKQKIIVEQQKHLVEEKNKEILDSITYAKRIQSAILPQEKAIKNYFPNSFIFYKPKDIVAGDFYWFEVIDDLIFFAAADCTGHGVPGAMVSVVCHNALNRSVKEFNLKLPNQILDKTREIVISEFEKSEEDVKDGMDISLCVFNLKEQKLYWSGAHNPLWVLRNKEIIEYKADKQPIGKFAYAYEFTLQEIEIQQNDELYFFTDGFQDQFGGEKGKKFKASKIKELLISNETSNLEEKSKILSAAFDSWKGDLEQVDDVCIIGVGL